MKKVLIAPATLAGLDIPYLKVFADAGFQLKFPPHPHQLTESELLAELDGVSASLAGSEPYTRRVLQSHPQLRVIARAGVGYDAVDVAAASELGLAVAIAPGTNQESVAEHTIGVILALAKRLISQHEGTRTGLWPRQSNLPLRGQVLGIAGLGRIGKAVAIRGAAFNMRLLAYEPMPDLAFAKQYHVELVSWDRLLADSDYLTLHMPLLPGSRYLINKNSLAKMKPTAYLINTARGGLVCEADLLEALRSKQLAGVGLDVFEEEPPPVKHPLFGFENCVFTPHAAGVDTQSRDDMALSAARTIVALSRGDWPAEAIVNPEVKTRFRW